MLIIINKQVKPVKKPTITSFCTSKHFHRSQCNTALQQPHQCSLKVTFTQQVTVKQTPHHRGWIFHRGQCNV